MAANFGDFVRCELREALGIASVRDRIKLDILRTFKETGNAEHLSWIMSAKFGTNDWSHLSINDLKQLASHGERLRSCGGLDQNETIVWPEQWQQRSGS